MADANERLRFAFWRYDQFPFVLGAEGEFDADGDFRAFSYGSTFKREAIIDVMSVERGREVHKLLEKLRQDYRVRSDQLLAEMMDKANAALPSLKPWRKVNGYRPN